MSGMADHMAERLNLVDHSNDRKSERSSSFNTSVKSKPVTTFYNSINDITESEKGEKVTRKQDQTTSSKSDNSESTVNKSKGDIVFSKSLFASEKSGSTEKVVLSINATKEEAERWKRIAKQNGVSFSLFAKKILNEYCRQVEDIEE